MSRSKVGVKVKGRGQGQIPGTQRSILGARLYWVQQIVLGIITSLRRLCVCTQGVYADNSADSVDQLLITQSTSLFVSDI